MGTSVLLVRNAKTRKSMLQRSSSNIRERDHVVKDAEKCINNKKLDNARKVVIEALEWDD